MVVIAALPTDDTGVWHDRVATPFRCTVHAPHWATPQPYLVPRKSSTSRRTQRRGISEGTSTGDDFPLTLSVYLIGGGLREVSLKLYLPARAAPAAARRTPRLTRPRGRA